MKNKFLIPIFFALFLLLIGFAFKNSFAKQMFKLNIKNNQQNQVEQVKKIELKNNVNIIDKVKKIEPEKNNDVDLKEKKVIKEKNNKIKKDSKDVLKNKENNNKERDVNISGNNLENAKVKETIENKKEIVGAPAPKILILSPLQNTTLNGKAEVKVSIKNNNGKINSLELYSKAGNVLPYYIGSFNIDDNQEGGYNFDTTKLPNGNYYLIVKNNDIESSVLINISNKVAKVDKKIYLKKKVEEINNKLKEVDKKIKEHQEDLDKLAKQAEEKANQIEKKIEIKKIEPEETKLKASQKEIPQKVIKPEVKLNNENKEVKIEQPKKIEQIKVVADKVKKLAKEIKEKIKIDKAEQELEANKKAEQAKKLAEQELEANKKAEQAKKLAEQELEANKKAEQAKKLAEQAKTKGEKELAIKEFNIKTKQAKKIKKLRVGLERKAKYIKEQVKKIRNIDLSDEIKDLDKQKKEKIKQAKKSDVIKSKKEKIIQKKELVDNNGNTPEIDTNNKEETVDNSQLEELKDLRSAMQDKQEVVNSYEIKKADLKKQNLETSQLINQLGGNINSSDTKGKSGKNNFLPKYSNKLLKSKNSTAEFKRFSPNQDVIIDSDGDGLSDQEEKIYHTDPFNPDTDGDGYLDGVEVANGYNPLGSGKLARNTAIILDHNSKNKEDVLKDSDGDGLSDQEEKIYHTDPFNPDTDGDGYLDGEEVLHGRDPLNPNKDDKIKYEEPINSGETKKEIYKVAQVKTITVIATSTKLIATSTKKVVKKEKKYLTIKGKALPNSFAILYIYSKPTVVVVKTDAYGNWTYTLDKTLADGKHEIYVAATNNTGKIVAKSEPYIFFVKQAKAVTVEEYNNREFGDVNVVEPTESLFRKNVIYFSVMLTLVVALVILFFFKKFYL